MARLRCSNRTCSCHELQTGLQDGTALNLARLQHEVLHMGHQGVRAPELCGGLPCRVRLRLILDTAEDLQAQNLRTLALFVIALLEAELRKEGMEA